MSEPGSDHGMFSPGNEAGIDPAYTGLTPDELERLASVLTYEPTPDDLVAASDALLAASSLAREHAALLRAAREASDLHPMRINGGECPCSLCAALRALDAMGGHQ